jgi:PII-like signaling protein
VLGTRLQIFLTEDDRIGRRRAHEVLLQRARDCEMAGVTIWRAIEGYGRSRQIRTSRFPDALLGLPVVLELLDEPGKVEEFLAVVSELAPGAFAISEPVRMARRSTGTDRRPE